LKSDNAATNELLMARLKEMNCDEESYDASSEEIYVTLETAMQFALDEGGERGKELYEFLCKEQEKRGEVNRRFGVKRSLEALEARARRAAKRVGLKAVKSKDRHSKSLGKGDRFKIIDPRKGMVVAGSNYDMPAAEVIGFCKHLPDVIGALLRSRVGGENLSNADIQAVMTRMQIGLPVNNTVAASAALM
jgi:hypothetical protein